MTDYNRNQIGSLANIENAVNELNFMLEHGDKSDFLFCLHNIAIAQGVGELAKKTGLSREGLYKILHPIGNPRLSVLNAILEAMDLQLCVAPRSKYSSRRRSLQVTRHNSLTYAYPALAAQWHPTLNKEITPNDILPTSRKIIWWKCINSGHEWNETPSSLITKFKAEFLRSGNYTESTFTNQLKQCCPLCKKKAEQNHE